MVVGKLLTFKIANMKTLNVVKIGVKVSKDLVKGFNDIETGSLKIIAEIKALKRAGKSIAVEE